jgi:hypothetical protein
MDRLLAERPAWDLYPSPLGLAMRHAAPGGPSREGAPLDGAAPDLALIRDLAVRLGRSRPLPVTASLAWTPGEPEPALAGLGAFKLSREAPEAAALEEAFPRRLALPEGLPAPSPRLRAWLSLALAAMAAHLAPPPGAPDPRGARTLVFDESPAILAAAALMAGSGPVSAISTNPRLSELARQAIRLNRLGDGPEFLPLGLPPWPRPAVRPWAGAFKLIVVNHSVHLAARALKDLAAWLDPAGGRLIATGVGAGTQSAHLVKAASRANLALVETSLEGDWAVLTLAARRPSQAAVWPWSPGDWLSELTEEDREALARVEALDKAGRRAGHTEGPIRFGGGEAEAEEDEAEELAEAAGEELLEAAGEREPGGSERPENGEGQVPAEEPTA